MFYRLLILASLVASVVFGCAKSQKPDVSATVPTGNAIARATAYVDSADSAVTAAKPHSSKTGVAILDQATSAHTGARDELAKAEASLQLAADQIKTEAKKAEQAEAAKALLQAKWYVRVGRWIEWAFWGLVALGSLHIALRVAGLFVSGQVGAVMATVGTILNPFGWIQAVCDNLFFRRKAKEQGQ